MGRFDPQYKEARLHFQDLFRRYGAPVILLDLLKHDEKKPREGPLVEQLDGVVKYLNQYLPENLQMEHIRWDFRGAAKR